MCEVPTVYAIPDLCTAVSVHSLLEHGLEGPEPLPVPGTVTPCAERRLFLQLAGVRAA